MRRWWRAVRLRQAARALAYARAQRDEAATTSVATFAFWCEEVHHAAARVRQLRRELA